MTTPTRALLVVLAAVAFVGAACSDSEPAATSSGAAAPPGLEHIHGLGVNPADGQLYVATHYGVFRVADGKATRMGTLIQDTMGFTVAGPDHFLGSGHPDIRNDTILADGMRPLLGLIESTNQATTWDGLSLQGEVDFHALAYAHNRVYGFDATGGRFLVSTDLDNWDTRTTNVNLIGIAVDPRDADHIVATTPDATVASTDGGRTWSTLAGAPRLWYVSWDSQSGLFGVTETGAVQHSGDGGTTWSQRGQIGGSPAALLAQPDRLYAATQDTTIVRSDDGGTTWTEVYTP